jgi:hypothetical protein
MCGSPSADTVASLATRAELNRLLASSWSIRILAASSRPSS